MRMTNYIALLIASVFLLLSPTVDAQVHPSQRPPPLKPVKKFLPPVEGPQPVVKKRIKYVAPTGFGGHQWGDLHSSFERLAREPHSVGAAWMRAVAGQPQFQCVLVVGSGGGPNDCDFNQTLLSLQRRFEGGGFYVMSEYRVEDQGFRFGGEGPVLYPVLYQFCANWDGIKREVPPKFDDMNKFCGMRMLFKSETRDELRKLSADHITNYDRILQSLIDVYGRPAGFLKRGRVTIETEEGESSDVADRRFSTWRWCPARDRALAPSCEGSVVLSFDPVSGTGTVLYASRVLWEYAYARHNSQFKNDMLFRMLHARN
jgi:hypothetical protein